MNKFYRKPGIIGGVCAGLAQYFNINVLLVRVLMVFIPFSIYVYLIIWLLSEIDEFN